MAKINLDTDQTLNFETDESCRTLRTNIILHGEEIKAIAITSTLPKEGKTSVAFNLAKSLAMVGKKTLFIDGDLRKSTFKEQYEVDAETNGLGSLLSGKKELADVVYTTNIDDLDIVLSDAPNNNSPELLDSNYFKELIPSVKKDYDYIIIDTPAIGNVIDGAIIAQECDGVVFVIEENAVRRKNAVKAIAQLEATDSKILGVVINKAKFSLEKNRYSEYYS